MDACNSVEKEVDKVVSKFTVYEETALQTLALLCQHVGEINEDCEIASEPECSIDQNKVISQAVSKVRETVQRVAGDHRELHSTVSKVGKAIDRNFVPDFSSTSREEVFASSEKHRHLNNVICQHFYRQGMLEIAEDLCKESGMKAESYSREPFTELNRILECLKQKDLIPALFWAKVHRERLDEQNSSLEFKLHRLHFIGLLSQGTACQSEALEYARTQLSPFVAKHDKDIQTLMGCLLYLPQGISSSPYSYLLDPHLWVEIHEVFMTDACSLLGLSVDSPLSVAINAGCKALPALLNIKQVMQQRQVTGIWSGKDELPIEIDLGKEHRYHSTFACPILRQQCTEHNPPMRLVCGHVISRDALNKLANGNKLKCPYCPVEQNPNDARQVNF